MDPLDKLNADFASGKFTTPDPVDNSLPDINAGNLKDTLNSSDFLDKARSFYRARDGVTFATDDEVRDKFLSDRRNRNLTDVGIGYDWLQGAHMSPEHAAEQAYLQNVYDAMPIGTDEQGDRSVGGFLAAAARLPFNVTNLIPFGGAALKAGAAAMVAERALGPTSRSALMWAAAKKGAIQGAKMDAIANAGLGAGFDVLTQNRNMEIGAQKDYSALSTAESAVGGAVLGGALGAVTGGFAGSRVPAAATDLLAGIMTMKGGDVSASSVLNDLSSGLSIRQVADKYGYTKKDEALFKSEQNLTQATTATKAAERAINEAAAGNQEAVAPSQKAVITNPVDLAVANKIVAPGETPATPSSMTAASSHFADKAEELRANIKNNLSDLMDQTGGDASVAERAMSENPEDAFTPAEKKQWPAADKHAELSRKADTYDRMARWPENAAALARDAADMVKPFVEAGEAIPEGVADKQRAILKQIDNGNAVFAAAHSHLKTNDVSKTVDDAVDAIIATQNKKEAPATVQPATQAAAPEAPQPTKFKYLAEDVTAASPQDLAAEYQAHSDGPNQGYSAMLARQYETNTGAKITDHAPIPTAVGGPPAKAPTLEPINTAAEAISALKENDKLRNTTSKTLNRATAKRDAGDASPALAKKIADLSSKQASLTAERTKLLERQGELKSVVQPQPPESKSATASIAKDTPAAQALGIIRSALKFNGPDADRLFKRAEIVADQIERLPIDRVHKNLLHAEYEKFLDEMAPQIYNKIFYDSLGQSSDEDIVNIARELYGDITAAKVESASKSIKPPDAIVQKMLAKSSPGHAWQPDGFHLLSKSEVARVEEIGVEFKKRLMAKTDRKSMPEHMVDAHMKRIMQQEAGEMVAFKLAKQFERETGNKLGIRQSTSHDRVINIMEGEQQVTASKIATGPRAFSREAVPGTEANIAAGGGQVLSRERVAGGSNAPGVTVRKATEGVTHGIDPETGDYMIEYGYFRVRTRDLKIENGEVVRKSGQKVYMSEEETALAQKLNAAIQNASGRLYRDPAVQKQVNALKAEMQVAKELGDKQRVKDLRAQIKSVTKSAQRMTARDIAIEERTAIMSNPALIKRITEKKYEPGITPEQAAVLNKITNDADRLDKYAEIVGANRQEHASTADARALREKHNEDIRGITARRALREAYKNEAKNVANAVEDAARVNGLSPEETEQAIASIEASDRAAEAEMVRANLLKAASDEFEITKDMGAYQKRIRQIMDGEELPRAERPTGTRPRGKRPPQVIEINGLDVDVNNDFTYHGSSERPDDVNIKFLGEPVGDISIDSKGRAIVHNDAEGVVSSFPSKDAAKKALPAIFFNNIRSAHEAGVIPGSLKTEGPTKKFPKDWTNSALYGRKPEDVVPAASEIGEELPLPAVKIREWKSNPDVSALNFDLPPDTSLAVMYEQDGISIVDVENRKLDVPQTAGKILGKKVGKPYAIGYVPTGVRGRTLQAADKFVPLDSADVLIETKTSDNRPPIVRKRVATAPSHDPNFAFDKSTGQAIFNRLSTITVDQAKLPERYRNIGLNTLADVYAAKVSKDNTNWADINTPAAYLRFTEEMITLNNVISELAPNGIRLPNTTRAAAMRKYKTIMAGYSPEEVSVGLDFLRRIGGLDADLPLLERAGDGFQYNAPMKTDPKANRVTLSPGTLIEDGVSKFPQFIPLIHELGHWAYHNILTPADHSEFWLSMGKYIGISDQNIEAMRAGRFDDLSDRLLNTKVDMADIQKRMSKLGVELPGISANEMSSPAEFMANQFSQWAVSEGKVNSIPLWRRVAKSVIEIARQFGVTWYKDLDAELSGQSFVDKDLIQLFKKILPDEDAKRYERYENLTKELPKATGREGVASLAAKQMFDFDRHRGMLDYAISSGKPDVLEETLLGVAREIFLPYGGNENAKFHTPNISKWRMADGMRKNKFARVKLLDSPDNLLTKNYLLKLQGYVRKYIHENRRAESALETPASAEAKMSIEYDNYIKETNDRAAAIGNGDDTSGHLASSMPIALMHAKANSRDEYVMHLNMYANELDTALYYAQIKFRDVIKSALSTDDKIVDVLPSGQLISRARLANAKSSSYASIARSQIRRQASAAKEAVASIEAEVTGLAKERAVPEKTVGDAIGSHTNISSMSVEQIQNELISMKHGNSRRRNDLLAAWRASSFTQKVDAATLSEEFMQLDEFSLKNKLHHAIKNRQWDRANEIAAVANFKSGNRNPLIPVVRVTDTIAKKVVDAHIEASDVGTSDNGIPPGTPANIFEADTKASHRNKDEERTMHSLFFRLTAAMGKADFNSPMTPDELSLLTGWGVKQEEHNKIYSSDAFRNFIGELRELSQDIHKANDAPSRHSVAGRVVEIIARSSMKPDEAAILGEVIGKLPAVEQEIASANPATWLSDQFVAMLNGTLGGSQRNALGLDTKSFDSLGDLLSSLNERAAVIMEGTKARSEIQSMKIYERQLSKEKPQIVDAIESADYFHHPLAVQRYARAKVDAASTGERHAMALYSVTHPDAVKNRIAYVMPFGNFGGIESVTTEVIDAIRGRLDEIVASAKRERPSRAAAVIEEHVNKIKESYDSMLERPEVTKGALMEEAAHWKALEDMGVPLAETKMQPVPVLLFTNNAFDLTHNAKYSTDDISPNSISWLIDSAVDRGYIKKEDAASIVGDLGNELSGRDFLDYVTTKGMMSENDLKDLLAEHSFDAIHTFDDELNTRITTPFDMATDTHPIDSPVWAERARNDKMLNEKDVPSLAGSMLGEFIEGPGVPDMNIFEGPAAVVQKMELADAVPRFMKKVQTKKDLTEADVEGVKTFTGFQLRSNSSRLAYIGATWLARKLDHGNEGFYLQKAETLGDVLDPVLETLASLPKTVSALGDFINKVKVWQKTPATDAHITILMALRQGPKYIDRLPPELKPAALSLRRAFDKEWDALNKLGLMHGKRENYVPQVWDTEGIKLNHDDFVNEFTEFFRREMLELKSPITSTVETSAREKAETLFDRLTSDNSGVILHDRQLQRGITNPLYERVLNLREADLLKLNKYLINNIETLTSTYFSHTVHKRTMTEMFGIENHAAKAYIRIALDGSDSAVRTLLNDMRTIRMVRAADGEMAERILLEERVIPAADGSEPEVANIVRMAVKALGDTQEQRAANKYKAKNLLMTLLPPEARRNGGHQLAEYEKRVDAIVSGLADFGPSGGARSKRDIQHMQAVMNFIEHKPIDGENASEMMTDISRKLRMFNSVTLLGYTALASIPDAVLPLVRSGSMTSWLAGLKYAVSADPELKSAIKSIGATVENLAMERMSDVTGNMSSRGQNAFFRITGQNAWHHMNREISSVAAWHHFKLEVRKVRDGNLSGQTNTGSYNTAMRTLKHFGLEEFANPGAPSIENTGDLRVNKKLRRAIIKFANETQFQPNPNDIPTWAQTPMGAVAFQLKTYPVLMGRLTGHVLKEAHQGNIKPLIALATVAAGVGAGTMAIRDVVQARGGDDERSRALRNRTLSEQNKYIFAALDNVGIKIHPGDRTDEFLGWYVQSLLITGGLGMIGELLYNSAAEADNAAFGRERIMSMVFGPTMGAATSAVQAGQDAYMSVADSENNSHARAALRTILHRIPILGGQKSLVEGTVDTLAGPK